jgi:hypothetical protein
LLSYVQLEQNLQYFSNSPYYHSSKSVQKHRGEVTALATIDSTFACLACGFDVIMLRFSPVPGTGGTVPVL